MPSTIHKSTWFIGITLLISWLLALLFFALGFKWNTLPAFLLMIVYMFVPMTVAIIVQKWLCKEPLREPLVRGRVVFASCFGFCSPRH